MVIASFVLSSVMSSEGPPVPAKVAGAMRASSGSMRGAGLCGDVRRRFRNERSQGRKGRWSEGVEPCIRGGECSTRNAAAACRRAVKRAQGGISEAARKGRNEVDADKL